MKVSFIGLIELHCRLPLSWSALEVLYLDGTNQVLLRCTNGLTMIFDAAFQSTSPLATYRLNANSRVLNQYLDAYCGDIGA